MQETRRCRTLGTCRLQHQEPTSDEVGMHNAKRAQVRLWPDNRKVPASDEDHSTQVHALSRILYTRLCLIAPSER